MRNFKTFGLRELEQKFPLAYKALPSSYKNDSALIFFIDVNDHLCAEHDLVGEYLWSESERKWFEIDAGVLYDDMAYLAEK